MPIAVVLEIPICAMVREILLLISIGMQTQLQPKLIIPIHYQQPRLVSLPLSQPLVLHPPGTTQKLVLPCPTPCL